MTMQFSVIIPTFRRPWLLRRCLRALAKQTLAPTSFEVIVADDDANDRLRHFLTELSKQLPYPLLYVPVYSTRGPAGARNQATQFARGDIVAFTDDDTIPDPSWLMNALVAFKDRNLVAAWGKIVVPTPVNPTDYQKNVSRLESAGFVTANAFCRRQRLLQVGGFDESFTRAWLEDSDLYFRLLQERQSHLECLRPITNAVVIHPIRKATWGCSVAHQANNFFNPLLFKKHPTKYRETIQKFPPVLYYAVVTTLVFAGVGFLIRRPEIGFIFLCTWLLLTAIFIRKRLKDTRRDLTHVCEILITSIAIPPLAIFWRLRGAFHWRVLFL